MNLVDLLDEDGLKQDQWSLTAPTLGEAGQLTVVGWSGRNTSTAKFYILKCNYCSQDTELFGEGYFKSEKYSLLGLKAIPCGCSKRPSWNKDQFAIMCERKAKELGYKFFGFVGKWSGQNTKIEVSCEEHGTWTTGSINNFISKGRGCTSCGVSASANSKIKPDDVMIASFLSTGSFHPDTKFWRSERENNQGLKQYWHLYCPDCQGYGESLRGDLQQGKRSCACSKHRQQECYINFIFDLESVVAVKFGIANNSKMRVREQNKSSMYDIRQHAVYKFPSVSSCKSAEKDCKKELQCGVVTREEVPDGWTETTYLYNLDKLKSIYERHGGVEIWPSL